jgi:acyl-coenzyme A synthetase/AMP-(fatty) acid ligase
MTAKQTGTRRAVVGECARVVACNLESDNPGVESRQVITSRCADIQLEERVSRFIRVGEGSFEELLLAVHSFQRVACAAYGAYCSNLDMPTEWYDIPALPLAAFRHTAIRSFDPAQTFRSFRTSGTTGEGYGEHHFRTLELYRSAALTGWRYAGLPQGNLFCLMASPEESPHSSLSCMAGWLASRNRFFLADWDRLSEAVSAERKPLVLFGTALAFLNLFESLGDRQLKLPSGSMAVDTGGYKGTNRSLPKSELYSLFRRHLGLEANDVWNEYGMTELSSQFYTRGLRNPHRGAAWVRARVINPDTDKECADGETGMLRVFDLANVGSCCVLQTRDLAIRRGADFELIGRDPAALPRGCSRTADELLGR